MENVINRIIKIEDQAQAIMRDAQRAEKNLNSDIEKKLETIRTDVEERVEKKYRTIQKNETEFADKKIEEIKRQYAEAQKRLEAIYEEKKDEWTETIYKAVLKIG